MNEQSINKNEFKGASDEVLYEFVMDEMEQESELIKGLWAKALAHAEGNDSKAKALYMQYRVQAIKDQLSALQIDLDDLSKEELFEIIKNGFTIIPEKIQLIKEEKAVAEAKVIEVAIEAEKKKEHEEYGKLGGWLIVFAIFLVVGNLYSFIMVEHFFENESLNTLKLLYQGGMDDKATSFKTIAYISFISFGLLLAFTISFFRKDILTKNLAIIYFGFNVVADLIMVYLLQAIDLPTINIMSAVIGTIFQTIFAVIWIRYFMVSERVTKTFVNGADEYEYSYMYFMPVGLGAIILASILYINQSEKNTLMAEQNTTSAVQTIEANATAPDQTNSIEANATAPLVEAQSDRKSSQENINKKSNVFKSLHCNGMIVQLISQDPSAGYLNIIGFDVASRDTLLLKNNGKSTNLNSIIEHVNVDISKNITCVTFRGKEQLELDWSAGNSADGIFLINLNNLTVKNLSHPEAVAAGIEKDESLPHKIHKIGDAKDYVGDYPDAILKDSIFHKKFIKLMGNEYKKFEKNIQVASPLEDNEKYYIGSGWAPHDAPYNDAIFTIEKSTGKICTATLSTDEAFNHTVDCYGFKTMSTMPQPIIEWYNRMVRSNDNIQINFH